MAGEVWVKIIPPPPPATGSSDDPAIAAVFTVTGVTPNADFTAGVKYRCWEVNATTTVVVTQAGWARGLFVGGGGGTGGAYGGTNPGGAAPGEMLETLIWLPVGTHTLTIGAGGLADTSPGMSSNMSGANGSPTTLLGYKALGGCGGPGGYAARGFGGNGTPGVSGAGASGNGGPNSGTVGGPGVASTITNASVIYGKGGDYNNAAASAANTGNGAHTGNKVGATGKAVLRIAVV